MLIYEVNIRLPQNRADEFRNWIPGHAQKLLNIEGFLRAEISESLEADSSNLQWRVSYYVTDEDKLDHYLAEHADKMRQEGIEVFGSDLKAERRVLRVLFESNPT